MNDQKNTNKENNPFNEDPFSVDVWERAYKNVGRPFEKAAFDSSKQKEEIEDIPFQIKNTIKDTMPKERVQKNQSTKEGSTKQQSSKVTLTNVSSGETVAPPKRTTTQQSQKPSYNYTPKENQQRSSAQKGENDQPISFLEMLENAFEEGSISDMLKNIPNLVRNAFSKAKSNEQSPFSMMWIVIVIFIFLLMLFGNG